MSLTFSDGSYISINDMINVGPITVNNYGHSLSTYQVSQPSSRSHHLSHMQTGTYRKSEREWNGSHNYGYIGNGARAIE